MSDESPYAGKSIEEIVHDYAVVRGDLVEQYARDQLVNIVERRIAEARREAVAGVEAVHARYFDLDGEPAVDDTTPEPEDVWRYDRDIRAVLGISDPIHPGDFDGVAVSALDLGLTSDDVEDVT